MTQSTSNKQNPKGLLAIFKGESGEGKSVGALSFPNAYVFEFDRKMPSITTKHFPGKEIYWDSFENIFQIDATLAELSNNCPYETLISDSLTHLVILVLNSMGQIKGEDPVSMMKNLVPTKGGKKQAEMMGFDYYNAETNFVERFWINALKQLWIRPGNPKNVIITAHLMTSEHPNMVTGITTRTRRIVTAGRSVAAYVPTEFDDMYHFAYETDMETGRNKRYVLTDNFGEDSAKTSFLLPEKIEFTGTPPLYEDGDFYKKFQKLINNDITI